MPDMTLTKEDLGQIRGLVRDEVETVVRHELHKAVDPLFAAVQQDIQRLDIRIDEVSDGLQEVRRELVELREQVHSLTTAVDRYVKRTNDWYQEFVVLKARHNLLHGKLVEKGIVTDDELTLG